MAEKIKSSDAENIYKIMTKLNKISYDKSGVFEKPLVYSGEKIGSIKIEKDGNYASLTLYVKNGEEEKIDLVELLDIKNKEDISKDLVDIKNEFLDMSLEEILATSRDISDIGVIAEFFYDNIVKPLGMIE